MGSRPSPHHSIHRIDNDGNYEPGNCRWADPLAQRQNRSTTILLTYQGETRPLIEWAHRLGINEFTLRNRIKRSGWTVEKAFSAPIRGRAGKSEVR